MSQRVAGYLTRVLLVMALALSLAATGFAHTTAKKADPDLAAYVAAGGSLADLCGDGPEGVSNDCDACRLVGAAVLTEPAEAGVPVQFATLQQPGTIGKPEPVVATFDLCRAGRAPPVV